jgi:hypothetical protein
MTYYISGNTILSRLECVHDLYRAFNQGGNREESVEPEQHFSRIAALTADSRMSQ